MELTIDKGCPHHEIFTAFFEAIQSSLILEGPPGQQIISHNINYLTKQQYKYLGYVIALSLMNGRPGPRLFDRAIAEKIAFGHVKSEVSIADVEYLRVQLLKVKEWHIAN